MNDWMHCNKCSLKYNPNMKLFLTECGHIFCQRCTEKIEGSKCIICEKPTTTIEFSKDMDFTIQQYFISFDMFLKKALEVYNFQMQHRARLFQAISQKYDYAKKECISCHNKNKNLARENKMLKAMLMPMGQHPNVGPHPFLTSTPALTSDNSQGDNMSAMSSIGFTPNIRPFPGYGQRIMPGDNRHMTKGPNYHQSHFYHGGSSKGPSPAQMVPNLNMARRLNMAPVHMPPGASASIEQLRRGGKRT